MRRAFTSSIYLRNAGAVLLILHKRFNLWVPVGGELEPNETPLEAAKREAHEETGIDPSVMTFVPIARPNTIEGTPDGFITYEEHEGPPEKGWHMNFAFLVDVPSRDVPKPCEEFTEFRWFNGNEPELLTKAPRNVARLVYLALKVYP